MTSTITDPSVLQHPRRVERLVTGEPTRHGASVTLTHVISGPALQRRLDPFLVLDAFDSDDGADDIAGFPDHPHRGFETVTYMIAGRMRHRDSAGHEALLTNGSVQWMTAGRGLLHSELPEQEEGRMEGFQLWLNLPASDKLCDPGYRDIGNAEIPEFKAPGVRARVVAGATHGVTGAVQRPRTEPLYLDMHLAPGTVFEQPLPPEHNAFVYVYRGALHLDGSAGAPVAAGRMAILRNEREADGVRLQAGTAPTRALLIAGAPLNEPIAQYGPFVMNTREQLFQAVEDFNAGRFG